MIKSEGEIGPDEFDYGVVNLVQLMVDATNSLPPSQLTKSKRKAFFKKLHDDLSDHLPVWVRLPVPGT